MLTVKEVSSARDVKEFINFPLRLYKKCPYFVPPLYGDEKKLVSSGGCSDTADSVFYLAVEDGKTVGRIQGIVQKQYNEIHNASQVRFTRFDSNIYLLSLYHLMNVHLLQFHQVFYILMFLHRDC